MRVELEQDEYISGDYVRGRVWLEEAQAQETDSVHFVVRGQEFSLVYFTDEEKTLQAAAQAHVFYEKVYDYPVRGRHEYHVNSDNGRKETMMPFALPLPEALPSTALLHLTTSENFMRIQYKLQVFRTGKNVTSKVNFQNLASADLSLADKGKLTTDEPESYSFAKIASFASRNRSVTSQGSTNSKYSQHSRRIQALWEPIPQNEKMFELYVHHTRASPDATPLRIRAPAWNPQHQATTTHLHVHVAERLQLVRSAFCGLYDYKTTSFRLAVQQQQSLALYVSPGQELRLVLTDPENFLRTWIDGPTTFVLTGKVTQTIQWYTSRRFVAYPIHSSWDLPEISFTVDPLDEETKDGISDPHILLDTVLTFPSEPTETFEGFMLSIQSEFMLGLSVVESLTGEKRAAGATAHLPLQVRGAGGLTLVTKESDVK